MSENADSWQACMRRGDFEDAWRISDRLLRARSEIDATEWQKPRHLQQVWCGEPLHHRRVLVRCYHGLGDTIQFVRFISPLRQIAREVIVWVQPPLLDLVATAEGVDRAIPLHDGTPDVPYDVDVEIMELAHILRCTATNLPTTTPYLFPGREPVGNPDSHLSVGIVTQAGDWDTGRSLPPESLHALCALPGLDLVNLTPELSIDKLAVMGARDASAPDLMAAARRVNDLDLIISVDTMMAHLAGALGRPVWTLLQKQCDWRWQEHGERSLWYPTARLFRQRHRGDWSDPVRAIVEALSQRLETTSSDTRHKDACCE